MAIVCNWKVKMPFQMVLFENGQVDFLIPILFFNGFVSILQSSMDKKSKYSLWPGLPLTDCGLPLTVCGLPLRQLHYL
jgi:hypothetical protein